MVIGVGYFAIDKFVFDSQGDAAREQEVARQVRSEVLVQSYGDKSIAVLPFVNMSTDPEQVFFGRYGGGDTYHHAIDRSAQ